MSSSGTKPTLRIDWCTAEAARFAVEHWHYSQRMPLPPHVRVGAWEDGRYVGCVLFSRGARPELGRAYGCSETEACELTRVALTTHSTPVTRIVALALRFLRKLCPGLKLVISFADPAEGHHGGIYQGGGWIYTGKSAPAKLYWHEGRWKHTREVMGGAFGGQRKLAGGGKGLPTKTVPGKHRYLMPLDDEVRERILPLARPYPKRAEKGSTVGTPGGEGGSIPTSAHHVS